MRHFALPTSRIKEFASRICEKESVTIRDPLAALHFLDLSLSFSASANSLSSSSNSAPLCRVNYDALQRLIGCVTIKDLITRVATIKYVKMNPRSNSPSARHVASVFHNRPGFSKIGTYGTGV